MQNFVLGFIFNKNLDKILLIKKIFKKDIPLELAKKLAGKLNGIGGRIEPNEFPISAMWRECKEETGLVIEYDKWTKFCELETNSGSIVYCFYTICHEIEDFK